METQAKIANKQKGIRKDRRKKSEEKGKKRVNLFKNHFRSGGQENERQMANNVMKEMRVYDGYLVCLDLA